MKWDNLGEWKRRVTDTIQETVSHVSNKTEVLMETQKLRSEINLLKRENKEDLLDLGQTVFDHFTSEEQEELEVSFLCEEIKSRQEQIKVLEEELQRRLGKGICKSCGAAVSSEAKYCPSCGALLQVEECSDTVDETKEETSSTDEEQETEVVDEVLEEAAAKLVEEDKEETSSLEESKEDCCE